MSSRRGTDPGSLETQEVASSSGKTVTKTQFTKNSTQKEHISVAADEEQVQWHGTFLKLYLKRKLGKNKEMLTEGNHFF